MDAARRACVIETTEVTYRRFSEVDAAFAYDEGEGDRSLAYWQQRAPQLFRPARQVSAKT